MGRYLLVAETSTLIQGWRLTIPTSCYLLYCALIAVVVRLVLGVFKALAIGVGEHLNGNEERKDSKRTSLLLRFLVAVSGFTGHKNVRDYWLPAIIGFCEATVYPVLILCGRFNVIGGWVTIRLLGNGKSGKPQELPSTGSL